MKENKKTYYRISDMMYEVDDIIERGLGNYSKVSNNTTCFYETYLEVARRQYYPNEVSRFNCIFACETKEALLHYIQKYHMSKIDSLYVYEILPIDDNCKISTGSFIIPSFNKGGLTFDEAVEDMKVYWDNNNISPHEMEVLIESNCKVVNVLGKPLS